MLGGLLLAFLPTGIVASVTGADWERDIFRLLMVASVSIAGIWPWAKGQSHDVARRLYIWMALAGSAAAHYLITTAALSLFVAFCLMSGASLDMWMTRAHMASEHLRSRLSGEEHRR